MTLTKTFGLPSLLMQFKFTEIERQLETCKVQCNNCMKGSLHNLYLTHNYCKKKDKIRSFVATAEHFATLLKITIVTN